MISNPIYPSINSIYINQIYTIIHKLKNKNVIFVTSLQKNFTNCIANLKMDCF